MLQIPKNVTQIGEINSQTKIYMEDYVHTFIERIRDDQTYLVFGKKEERSDVLIYMIYGVEKKTDWDRGSYPYFKKYERIGTLEGHAGKKVFKSVRGSGIPLTGYFVFYEQNEDMQAYMIASKEKSVDSCEDKEKVMEEMTARMETRRKEREEREKARTSQNQQKRTGFFSKSLKSKAATPASERSAAAAAHRTALKPVSQRQTESSKQRTVWTIPELCRMGSLALLLVLVVTAVTSINQYPDMKEVVKIFSDAAETLNTKRNEDHNVNSILLVEENTENQQEARQESLEDEETKTDQKETESTFSSAEIPAPQTETITETTPIETTADPIEAATSDKTAAETETVKATTEQPPEMKQQNEEENAVAANATPKSYIVKKGDNLAEIIRGIYGSTERIKEICELNGIKDPDHIQPGQNILLP